MLFDYGDYGESVSFSAILHFLDQLSSDAFTLGPG
jgi:hypothetical protein